MNKIIKFILTTFESISLLKPCSLLLGEKNVFPNCSLVLTAPPRGRQSIDILPVDY